MFYLGHCCRGSSHHEKQVRNARTTHNNRRRIFDMQRLRIIQCGTGVAGKQALRAILENRSLHLVGLFVHSAENRGRRATELAGISSTDETPAATDCFAEILALQADAVCYMMLMPDVEQICALLASGKNVVTTAGLMLPAWHSAAVQAQLDAACESGNSSFYVSGINPGWVDEILPLTMSVLCRRIEQIHIREYADCSKYPAPHILNVMGFGRPLADVQNGSLPDLAIMREFFQQSVAALAHGLELKLDEVRESRDFIFSGHAYDIAAGHIPQGTIAGQRWRWVGISGGVERIVQETFWITALDLGPGWPGSGETTNDTQWCVTIEGSPSLRCTFEPRYSFLDRALAAAPDYNPSGLATAMAAVNSLQPVAAARAGTLTSADLPLPRSWQFPFGAHHA
jgi:2,4-diaminopentanoate dehydrogenase